MKILWLAPYPHPLELTPHPVPWVSALAAELSQHAEIELTILNWTSKITNATEEFTRGGIRFIYLKVPSVRIDILTLYRRRIALVAAYLRQHYQLYDLLHLHGSELQLPAMTAGLRVPQLLSVQGLVSQYTRFVPGTFSKLKFLWTLAGYYERRYLPDIHHFSCRTHWDKAQVKRLSPGCTVYHNWEIIRPEFFKLTRPPVPATGRPQLLFMGGSQVLKGFQETLAAFDLIRQQVDMKLIVVGRTDNQDLAAAIRRAGLRHIGPGDVECRQFLSAAELMTLFSESLCLLHPSHVDNSPNSVCEAQVAGLPVVAANVGGVSSLIEHGQTGLLCDLNPATIARQALQLHHDPGLRLRLIEQARTTAWQRHNSTTIGRRTVAIYRAVHDAFHQLSPDAVAGPQLRAAP